MTQPHSGSAPGPDSLRSSDEFPANKENHEGSSYGTCQGAAAGERGSLGERSGTSHVVSEQAMAQQAVYALQVSMSHSSMGTPPVSYPNKANCQQIRLMLA